MEITDCELRIVFADLKKVRVEESFFYLRASLMEINKIIVKC